MKKEFELAQALKPLASLLGKWGFEGHIKHKPGIKIKGRETYEPLDGGHFILLRWDVVIIWEKGKKEVNSGLMVIGYDSEMKTFTGSWFDNSGANNKYEIGIENNVLIIATKGHRFTGTFSKDKKTITGKWEHSGGGGYTYSYDKILTKAQTKNTIQ